jgi:hypothetical protein
MAELSMIQKTYDLIKWYVPILNCLPKAHKFTLGDIAKNELVRTWIPAFAGMTVVVRLG